VELYTGSLVGMKLAKVKISSWSRERVIASEKVYDKFVAWCAKHEVDALVYTLNFANKKSIFGLYKASYTILYAVNPC